MAAHTGVFSRLFSRFGSAFIGVALLAGFQSITPVHAAVANPILGSFDPSNIESNPYADCIAATLVGNGFSFNSISVLAADLGTLWPNIPNSVATACKTAVDGGFNQACMVTTVCTGVTAADNAAWIQMSQALDTWDLTADNGFWKGSAITHYPANATLQTGPQASITFNIPSMGPVDIGGGLTSTIGELPFMIYGRTPTGGASGFHLHIAASNGRVYDGEYCFSTGACTYPYSSIPSVEPLCNPPVPPGNIDNCNFQTNTYPDGRFAPSIHNVRMEPSGGQLVICAPPTGGAADCSGLQVTFTFTFYAGTADSGGTFTATSAGITRLWLQWQEGTANVLIDSALWSDPRWVFTSPGGLVQNHDSRAPAPQAVINPEPGTASCLVGLDVAANPTKFCFDRIGSPAPVVQSAVSSIVRRFVATGDSYSSGEGVPPFQAGTNLMGLNVCHRSDGAYGPLVHAREPVVTGDLDFAACSGAKIEDYFNPNHSNSGEPDQLSHITSAPTTLVTIGISGNDIGFDAIGNACVDASFSANSGYHNPCGPFLETAGQDQPKLKITQLATGIAEEKGTYSLTGLLADVANDAPNARVFVMGYPNPLPANPTQDCSGHIQLEDGTDTPGGLKWYLHPTDMTYMNQVFSDLNVAMHSAAVGAGFIFVDNTDTFRSDSGTLCDGSRSDLHGIIVQSFTPVLGFPPIKAPPSEYSLHPTANGQSLLADALQRRIANPYGPGSTTLNISLNQTIQQPLSVPSGLQQLAVQTAWPGSDVQLSLISPSGTTYSRTATGPGVIHKLIGNTETLDVFDPQPGQWTIQLFGASVSGTSEPVQVGVTPIAFSDFAPAVLVTSSSDRGVAPVTVQFSSAGTGTFGGGAIASYNWDFGDGSTSAGANPNHLFTNAGTFLVTLTVTDTNGQTGTGTEKISVGSADAPPTVGFDWGSIDPTNPTTIAFDARPSTDAYGQITSYSWNFGDGGAAAGGVASHQFAAAGSYAVTLKATNNSGQTGSSCELVTTGQSSAGATVTACPQLTITASDGSMTYGGTPPGITPNYVGFVSGDTSASLSTQPTCASAGAATTPAGTYPGATSCSGAVDPKYLIGYMPGTLTVNRAPLTVTPDNQSIVYGSPIPPSTYQISGFVNGENPTTGGVSGAANCSSSATTASPAGTYPISCTQGTLSAANYSLAFGGGSLLVVKHQATVGYTGETFFSAGTGPTANVTLTGILIPDPGGNPDLTRGTPMFNLYSSTNPSLATPDTTCAAAVTAAGVVTCSIPNLGIDNWTVVLRIPDTDGYFSGPSSSPVVVTVFQPSSGTFATGGGWIVDPSYQNIPVGISSSNNRGNFGFNIRYAAGTATPQGQFVYVFRGADGFDYQVKSISWTGGGAAFGATGASFGGQASVTVIDPTTGSTVSGLGGSNFTFRVDVAMGGSGGPTFALSVYNSPGNLYHQAGTAGNEIPIGGGNILIHS